MYVDDRLVNLVSGLGTDKDKSENSFFAQRLLLKYELDAAYQCDWLAGAVVDTPCDDLTRKWREWKGGSRQTKALLKSEKRLKVRAVVNHALKMARLYGGSVILLGDGSAHPEEPLEYDRIEKGGLKYINALSRYEVYAGPLDRDPLSEGFSAPTFYSIPSPDRGAVQVHPTRIIRFHGQAKLETLTTWDGWGLSTLQRCYTAIRNVASTCSNLAAMTFEGKLDVIHIPGLSQNVIDPNYRNAVMSRFALANTMKSINNALVLDAEEEWEQKTLNFSNFPEVLRTYLEIAAGAADIPLTRLLGVQSKGIGNSGEQDLRNYYDGLSARQQVEIAPGLEKLDMALSRDAGVPDPEYEWNPLWQMRESEVATIQLQNAQRDQIYATMSLCQPDALREMILGRLTKEACYPGMDEILEKYAGQAAEPLAHKTDITMEEINTPSSRATTAKS